MKLFLERGERYEKDRSDRRRGASRKNDVEN